MSHEDNNMKHRNALRAGYGGSIRRHWQWSIALAFLLIVLDVVLLYRDRRSGLIALIFSAFYLAAVLAVYAYLRPRIMRELIAFATHYGQVENKILQDLKLPCALMEPDGRILWINHELGQLTQKKQNYHKNIGTLFPELSTAVFPAAVGEKEIELQYQDKEFHACIQKISMDELMDQAEVIEKEADVNDLYMLYLFDVTHLNETIRENRQQRPVVGMVHLDNYEEVMERTDEVHQSLLNVLVERRINKYFTAMNGLVKKLEKDKYLVIMNRKSLDSLKADRFSVLEDVKTISIGNDIAMTLSIGLGAEGGGYLQNYENSRSAIELALGRGGDQAVIRSGDEIIFFGGKTQHAEKSTRVKARVKAQALRELILSTERVVTMGHRITDMDSFGAAIGICRAAITVGKPVHLVIGEENMNIRDWLGRFNSVKEYGDDLFITHEQARELVDKDTALIVVDTNRPSMTECREILDQTRSVVVLDHHRQGTETIEGAALSYIEPGASSACEMVAEILQYFEENVRLRPPEADALYAGIVVDTNNFMAKAGVRTFEAAAYLRRNGADVIRVRKALRDDAQSYMAKVETVRAAQTFMDCYAISICRSEGLDNANTVAAQAANELLNVEGLKASFVFTEYDQRIFISARSIDEMNVQLVMERLGGGGHMNIAGAQIVGKTMEESIAALKDVLKQMNEEGAIQ